MSGVDNTNVNNVNVADNDVANAANEAAAALLFAKAQSVRLENRMRKLMLQRDLAHLNQVDQERQEAHQSQAPSRKRDRDYADAHHAVQHDNRMKKLQEKQADNDAQHQDRLKKLQEKQANDSNVRSCSIARKTRNLQMDLEDIVKAAESDIEFELNRQRQVAQDTAFDNKQHTLQLQHQLAALKSKYEHKMEALKLQDQQHHADIALETQQRDIRNSKKLDVLRSKLQRANVRLELYQKHGAAIPDHLFE